MQLRVFQEARVLACPISKLIRILRSSSRERNECHRQTRCIISRRKMVRMMMTEATTTARKRKGQNIVLCSEYNGQAAWNTIKRSSLRLSKLRSHGGLQIRQVARAGCLSLERTVFSLMIRAVVPRYKTVTTRSSSSLGIQSWRWTLTICRPQDSEVAKDGRGWHDQEYTESKNLACFR